MNVLPGEPLPPGFEDEPVIQAVIQAYKGNALIGLEYAIELQNENGRESEPNYMCVLCDKRSDPRTIMQHWTSYGHRLEYLDKHFPSAMRELQPVRNKREKMKVMVQALSEAIERHHGRLQLSVVSTEDFRRSRAKIYEEVKGKFHYDERNGPNFVNVIDRSLLQLTSQMGKSEKSGGKEELDEISSDSDAGPNSSKKSRLENQAPAYRTSSVVKRSPPFVCEERREDSRKIKFPTPKELSLQASHIAQERYKWEKYRCALEIYLKDKEKSYKEYEKSPEKHPLYPEEWKAFWNRRYKELQKEKKVDPNKYDYRPEWALFWSKRRKELFDVEVEKKKKEIKLKLELPEDAEEILDKLKEKYKIQANRKAPNESNGSGVEVGVRRTNTAVINISDEDEPPAKSSPRRRSHSRSRSSHISRSISPRLRSDQKRTRLRSKSRSISPFSDEFEYDSRQIIRGKVLRGRGVPPPILSSFSTRRYPPAVDIGYREATHSYYKHPLFSSHFRGGQETFPMHPQYESGMISPTPLAKQRKEPEPEPEEEGPLTVVAVLRLLTALEDILGSLGPKMVDLLGKALALENVQANSADELLLNDDNCVFFETAKEKLKGLLIAEVVEDPQKVRAVKKAIKNIAAIVHQVAQKGKNADKKEEATANSSVLHVISNVKMNKAVNIKELPFDRQLVASKLASELVKEGREDLSTADMDKLIYFFILMAKLSKGKCEIDEKPLYLKDIATEIGVRLAPSPVVIGTVAVPPLPPKLTRNTLESFVDDLFDEDAIDAEVSNGKSEKSTKNEASSSLESLTDSDLQTLLQNFKHLSTEEQHHLIAHLKKLETTDPTRVEKLRKFVNLDDLGEAAEEGTTSSKPTSPQHGRNDASVSSVASNRASSSKNRDDNSPRRSSSKDRIHDPDDDFNDVQHTRGINVANPNKFSLDDEDDDDYNFEDVLKAASSIVDSTVRQSKVLSASKSNSAADPPAPGTSKSSSDALTFNRAAMNSAANATLSDTQNIIANLMGNLQQNNATKKPPAQSAAQGPPVSQPVQPIPLVLPSQNIPQPNMPYYQSYNQQQQQQQYSQQQYPPQQQYPQQQAPPQAYGDNNQMGYNQMGYNQAPYYGYNNSYQGYPQQPPQQWGSGYNMYGGN